jgi:hypothetical protein
MWARAARLFVVSGFLAVGLAACDSGTSSKQSSEPQAAAPAAQPASAQASCDRDCLKGMVDQFLAAMVAHDSSKAAFADNVRYTENGIAMSLKDGMWATASDLPTTKIYAAQPDEGAVVFYGLMKESGDPVVLCLRLKVADAKISEAEMLVARPGERLYDPDTMTPQPVFDEVEDPATRTDSKGLIEIANKYFDGIEQGTGSFVPFDDACIRIENGEQTVLNPKHSTGVSAENGTFNLSGMTCKEQFNTGFWRYINRVYPRRYTLTDPERGLVFGVVNFDHAGTVKSVDVPGYGKVMMPSRLLHPYESVIGELFKVRNGKILKIEALVISAPYKMQSGWE